MILKELRVMRGPNMWSENHCKLIVLKLDFSAYDEALVKSKLPALLNGDEEDTGRQDFFYDFTLAIARTAAQIQPESENFCFEAQLRGKSSYYAIFSYEFEEVGLDAAREITDRADDLLEGKEWDLGDIKEYLQRLHSRQLLGPSTAAIVNAAISRKIPVKNIEGGLIALGQGKYMKRISASILESTGDIAVDIAADKDMTKSMLAAAMIPVPQGVLVRNEEALKDVAKELGYPLVTKPLDGHQGKGITGDITKHETLVKGFHQAKEAKKRSDLVIVEKHIKGDDYRFLVIGYKFIAAAKRVPACVVGDGQSSIEQLIERINSDPKRADGHAGLLSKIKVDNQTLELLKENKLSLDSVPESGQTVYLKDTANLSTGGTAIDVTDKVHPENILLAERTARIIGLDICGIDIMAPDVKTPIVQNGGAVLEVNAAPGLRMHIAPSFGKPRNVGDPIIDMMFPDGKVKIPIVAVTGTNGKTTTSRLMAFIASHAGHNVGFTSTDGIYINNMCIHKGDCSGPKSSELILQEPSIDFAVLECARGGIIRSGLAFTECDVAIVTNVAADHLGLKDIYTVEDLAEVKSVVPRSVSKNGYAILNASDDLAYGMKEKVRGKIGLFSLDPENKRIQEHCQKGGTAISLDAENNIIIIKGEEIIKVENVVNIPLTVKGMADFMIENVMSTTLASYLMGIPLETIKTAIRLFKPSAELTPGRLNIFDIRNVNVIVDYAHNPHGLQALGRLLKQINSKKTGIVTGVGDRRDQDIVEMGRVASSMYDEIVIRIDKDTRGRAPEDIARLISQGIDENNKKTKYHLIPDGREALKFAIRNSSKDDYVIMSADDAIRTVEMVKDVEREEMELQQNGMAGSF